MLSLPFIARSVVRPTLRSAASGVHSRRAARQLQRIVGQPAPHLWESRETFRRWVLRRPRVQLRECCIAATKEDLTEAFKIPTEMVECRQRIIRETRICWLYACTSDRLHGTHVLGMVEAPPAHVVLDEPERPSKVQFEPPVAPLVLPTCVSSATALALVAHTESEAVRHENALQLPGTRIQNITGLHRSS